MDRNPLKVALWALFTQLLDLEINRTVSRLEVLHRDPMVGEDFCGTQLVQLDCIATSVPRVAFREFPLTKW
jgi:hypothetical protein